MLYKYIYSNFTLFCPFILLKPIKIISIIKSFSFLLSIEQCYLVDSCNLMRVIEIKSSAKIKLVTKENFIYYYIILQSTFSNSKKSFIRITERFNQQVNYYELVSKIFKVSYSSIKLTVTLNSFELKKDSNYRESQLSMYTYCLFNCFV